MEDDEILDNLQSCETVCSRNDAQVVLLVSIELHTGTGPGRMIESQSNKVGMFTQRKVDIQ